MKAKGGDMWVEGDGNQVECSCCAGHPQLCVVTPEIKWKNLSELIHKRFSLIKKLLNTLNVDIVTRNFSREQTEKHMNMLMICL